MGYFTRVAFANSAVVQVYEVLVCKAFVSVAIFPNLVNFFFVVEEVTLGVSVASVVVQVRSLRFENFFLPKEVNLLRRNYHNLRLISLYFWEFDTCFEFLAYGSEHECPSGTVLYYLILGYNLLLWLIVLRILLNLLLLYLWFYASS